MRSDDRALVRAFLRRRDEPSFVAVYDACTPALYGLALRLTGGAEADAQDIVQETWFRAVRGLARFRGRSFRAWLAGIATNCARELARARARSAELPEQYDVPSTDEPLLHTVDRVHLGEAVAALPAGFREILVLHDVEGYTHPEIAAMLGIAVGTSKSQLSRARRAMRAFLGSRRRKPSMHATERIDDDL